MQMRVKTVDGRITTSDYYSKAEVMEMEGYSERQFEEVVAGMEEVLRNLSRATHVVLKIDNKPRYFNPVNIVWAEFDEEDR